MESLDMAGQREAASRCASRVHFQRRHSVLYTLESHVDVMTMERLTSGQPVRKRQTVRAYRALRVRAIERYGN